MQSLRILMSCNGRGRERIYDPLIRAIAPLQNCFCLLRACVSVNPHKNTDPGNGITPRTPFPLPHYNSQVFPADCLHFKIFTWRRSLQVFKDTQIFQHIAPDVAYAYRDPRFCCRFQRAKSGQICFLLLPIDETFALFPLSFSGRASYLLFGNIAQLIRK